MWEKSFAVFPDFQQAVKASFPNQFYYWVPVYIQKVVFILVKSKSAKVFPTLWYNPMNRETFLPHYFIIYSICMAMDKITRHDQTHKICLIISQFCCIDVFCFFSLWCSFIQEIPRKFTIHNYSSCMRLCS